MSHFSEHTKAQLQGGVLHFVLKLLLKLFGFEEIWTIFFKSSGIILRNTVISFSNQPFCDQGSQLFARNVHNPLRGCVHSEFLARRETGTKRASTQPLKGLCTCETTRKQNNATLQNSEYTSPFRACVFLTKGRPWPHFRHLLSKMASNSKIIPTTNHVFSQIIQIQTKQNCGCNRSCI